MRTKNRGYIYLCGGYSDDPYYCYGHLTLDEFREDIRETGVEVPDNAKLVHTFARFIPLAKSVAESLGYDCRFEECKTSGRGAFKVTVWD